MKSLMSEDSRKGAELACCNEHMDTHFRAKMPSEISFAFKNGV